MLNSIQKDHKALWKLRYRLPVTYGIQIAALNPAHGLALSTHSGAEQYYAWYLSTGDLKALTDRSEGAGNTGDGVPGGTLSPDGRFLYYFSDEKGNETGHFVRVPFHGGDCEDITPGLPLYTGFMPNFSQQGHLFGFTALIDGVYFIYALEIQPGGMPGQLKLLYQSPQQTRGPIFSQDGKIAGIETKQPGAGNFDFIAIEIETGQSLGHLAGEDVELYLPSPLEGDQRFLALSNRSGSYK
jgi:Tol biopolymer transport system component